MRCSRCSIAWSFFLGHGGAVGPIRGQDGRLAAAVHGLRGGALTAITRSFVPELNIVLVTLSAILILIPGLPLTVGMVELAHGPRRLGDRETHERTGLPGQAVRRRVARRQAGGPRLVDSVCSRRNTVRSAWLWLAIPLLIVALCIAFQTGKRDFLAAAVGCAGAYGGILLGSALAGANLGNLFGTIAAVVFANLWARRTRRPTSIALLPAIVLLVSGSIGFRGLATIAVGQVATGEQQFIQMFVVALTIAAGLLVGNTIVRPKTTL